MKRFIVLTIACFLSLGMMTAVVAEGSISCDKQSFTMDVNQEDKFTVTADNAAGRIDIKVADESIVSVSTTKEWVDMSSFEVTIKALKPGKTTITVELTDIADYDGEILEGDIVIEVNVNGEQEVIPEASEGNNTSVYAIAAGAVAVAGVGVAVATKGRKKKED